MFDAKGEAKDVEHAAVDGDDGASSCHVGVAMEGFETARKGVVVLC